MDDLCKWLERLFVIGIFIIIGILFYSVVSIDIDVSQTPTTRADCTHAMEIHDKEMTRLIEKLKELNLISKRRSGGLGE